MNNQGDKASQKERGKSPENKLTDIEICDLNDREFRMVQYQQFQELKKYLDEQSKEIETLKKNQIELLEMKNTLQELKNEIASLENRVDQMEERSVILKTEI